MNMRCEKCSTSEVDVIHPYEQVHWLQARIAELEEALRDMVRYDQWAESPGCNCQVCEIKRHVRELLEES